MSNVFMTIAWYGHLKNLATNAWYIAALISWGIAQFEYLCRCRQPLRLQPVIAALRSSRPCS